LLGRIISERKISSILDLLKLNDYLIHQPQGIDSFVDSGGRRLPRSIIQKLLVARILIDKPRLLLMEDPLQFIEDDEKKRIIDYIMDEKQKWTVVVVSDYFYWEEKSNKVIQLNKK